MARAKVVEVLNHCHHNFTFPSSIPFLLLLLLLLLLLRMHGFPTEETVYFLSIFPHPSAFFLRTPKRVEDEYLANSKNTASQKGTVFSKATRRRRKSKRRQHETAADNSAKRRLPFPSRSQHATTARHQLWRHIAKPLCPRLSTYVAKPSGIGKVSHGARALCAYRLRS